MYARPETLEAALEHMAGGGWSVLAGGTDFYPSRVGKPLTEPVLDISAISSLRGIQRTEDGWKVEDQWHNTELTQRMASPVILEREYGQWLGRVEPRASE